MNKNMTRRALVRGGLMTGRLFRSQDFSSIVWLLPLLQRWIRAIRRRRPLAMSLNQRSRTKNVAAARFFRANRVTQKAPALFSPARA